MYTKVSIPKLVKGAGAPAPKEPNVIFILATDVLTMPSKNGVVSTSDLVLKPGAEAVGVYLNPRSIARNDNSDGEAQDEVAGWISSFTGARPGDDEHFAAWIQENLNEGVLILTTECGNSKGTRLQGTPCNPLFPAVEGQDTIEGIMSTLSYAQGMRSKNKMIHYRHALPALAADAVIEEGSGGEGI